MIERKPPIYHSGSGHFHCAHCSTQYGSIKDAWRCTCVTDCHNSIVRIVARAIGTRRRVISTGQVLRHYDLDRLVDYLTDMLDLDLYAFRDLVEKIPRMWADEKLDYEEKNSE